VPYPGRRATRLQVRSIVPLLALVCLPALGAGNLTDEEWLDGDAEQRALEVNEGALEFYSRPPATRVHHYDNRITITARSLVDGWVEMRQCHEHLDPVPRVQIVFSPSRLRDLRVISTRRIARAWVEGASVQLADVRRGARLCLQAKSRALSHGADGDYVLRNGPYMRRFLDGYYPMHVTMNVRLPAAGMTLARVSPRMQPGFRVRQQGRTIRLDAWFTGRLVTELHLRAAP
jgi:hypothetical protein